MNRGRFFGLLAAAPVGLKASTCIAPLVASVNGAPAIRFSKNAYVMTVPHLTLEKEFVDRYLHPYFESLEHGWREAEKNGTAWWLPQDMQVVY